MGSKWIGGATISILICSRDRREDLEKLVDYLKRMKTTYAFQLVVVEETDKPNPINGITYVSHPIANRGISYARNLALSNATGDIVVFLDDDCVISDGWLEKLLEPFTDSSLVGVQGGVSVPGETNAIGWGESILGFPGGGIQRVFRAKGENRHTKEISTLNCAYRKWVFDRIGGFDERLKLGGEDYVFAKQACGYGPCLFVPDAIINHEARGSLRKIWHWFVRRGRAEIDVIKSGKQKDTTVWSVLKSSLSVKLALLVMLGITLADWFIPLMLIALLAYCMLQYVRYAQPWKNSGGKIKVILLLPIVKFTMDLAMDWGRLRGFIFD